MARLVYGATAADYVIDVANGRPKSGVVLSIYTARTGGTQVTDLLDMSNNPITTVTSDSLGGFRFQGPDGQDDVLWAQAAGDTIRYAISPTVTSGSPYPTTADLAGYATTADLDEKADTTYVDTQLAGKASTSSVSAKADTSYVDSELALKVDTADLTGYAVTSGGLSQFAGVSDSTLVDGDVYQYDGGTNTLVPVQLSSQYAQVGADSRIVEAAYPFGFVPIKVINEGDDTSNDGYPAGTIYFSRPAPASLIPTPIGSSASTATGNTSRATTLTDSVAIGEYVIAAVMTSGEAGATLPQAVTFSFGGTGAGAATDGWQLLQDSVQSGTVQASIYYAKLTTAASSGSTITATVGSTRTHMAVSLAKGINLAAIASQPDAAVANNGWSSTSTMTRSLGPSGSPTAAANAIAFMAVGYNGGTATGGAGGTSNYRDVAGASGWSVVGPTKVEATTSGASRAVGLFYKVLTATGTVTGNFTFSSTGTESPPLTGAHCAALGTLKAA